MKRIAIILLMMLLLLVSACEKPKTEEITTKTSQETTQLLGVVLSTPEHITVSETEMVTDVYKTTKIAEETTAKTQTTKGQQQNLNEVPPYILTVNLDDLGKIKNASMTMSEDDFAKYMDENFANEAMNGMDSIKNANKILEELENSYIVFVDEPDKEEVISFYIESHFLFQDVEIKEGVFIRSRIYTDSRNGFEYKDGDVVKHLKTYEANGIILELFENTTDVTEGLYGNIKSDGQTIPFFTNVKINVEEFETVFPRLGIVKIGDLLSE